ncbi:BON domain-containing protein [Burkholderia multivorans]|uniref:BON domain-containing protein n=1 Tax=Burkholderia multivorans TaxID=87883 RepID=UPI001C24577A|nr:BON domain-containing protein [Burkholderia multivorans]MBU9372451.1 BON domain-containing protein [Burkholderia multivorans]
MESQTRLKPLMNLAAAVACGAVAMYFLDPASGRRRRAYVCDKAAAGGHGVVDYASNCAKQATDRARSAIAGLREHWQPEHADDALIAARVRAELARLTGRPHDIDVSVEDGHVRLSGAIDEAERQAIVDGVSAVDGVRTVDDGLGTRSEYRAGAGDGAS